MLSSIFWVPAALVFETEEGEAYFFQVECGVSQWEPPVATDAVGAEAMIEEAVLQQGHRLYGENRVQEAAGKWPGFRARFENVAVHLIGPLQWGSVRHVCKGMWCSTTSVWAPIKSHTDVVEPALLYTVV